MSAKEVYAGNIFAAVSYRHGLSVVVHADKSYYFIERSFGIELNLTVLVGHAQSLYGGLSYVYFVAVKVYGFAETFAPKLSVPIRHKFKTVGIRHHYGNIAALAHSYIL